MFLFSEKRSKCTFNDILLATDKGNAVALVLLDLSSTFEMVDHNI